MAHRSPVATPPVTPASQSSLEDGDRRRVDVGPPIRSRERRVRHRTPSGLVATDGLKMSCPCCGASESAVMKTTGEMKCPACGFIQSEVVKVRGLIDADAIRRRRECASCGTRFPTTESVDLKRLEQEAAAHGLSIEKYTQAP